VKTLPGGILNVVSQMEAGARGFDRPITTRLVRINYAKGDVARALRGIDSHQARQRSGGLDEQFARDHEITSRNRRSRGVS